MKKNSGYILVLSVLLISISVILISTIIQKTFSYTRQVRLVLNQEKARTLALAGIELALSQLSFLMQDQTEEQRELVDKKEKKNKDQEVDQEIDQDALDEKNKQSSAQAWLVKILSVINSWQTVELHNNTEGIDGTIQLYITAEQGKINFSYMNYDTKTKPEQKNAIELIDNLLKKEIQISIVDILKESKKMLGRMPEDPTELLKNSSFKAVFKDKLFAAPEAKNGTGIKNIYAMDLFTHVDGSGKLNPWLLSPAVQAIAGLRSKDQATSLKDMAKHLKKTMQWNKDWDVIFAPLWGKKYEEFGKEIDALFSTQFEVTAFSVIVYARVGSVTQKISALLDRDITSDQATKNIIFRVAKLYWL